MSAGGSVEQFTPQPASTGLEQQKSASPSALLEGALHADVHLLGPRTNGSELIRVPGFTARHRSGADEHPTSTPRTTPATHALGIAFPPCHGRAASYRRAPGSDCREVCTSEPSPSFEWSRRPASCSPRPPSAVSSTGHSGGRSW